VEFFKRRLVIYATLLLAWACGGGSGGSDTQSDATAEAVAEAVSDAAAEAVAEAVAEAEVQEPPWVPATPVEAQVFIEDLPANEGLAFDGGGSLYVSLSAGGLLRVAPDGSYETLATVPPAPGQDQASLAGLAVHSDWGLVVAHFNGDRLHRYTSAEGLTLLRDGLASGPNGLAFDPDGRLYVSLSSSGKVVRLATPQAEPELVAEGIQYANGLAFSRDGHTLYVNATTPHSALWRVDLGGALPATPTVLAEDPLLQGPDGLALAPDGWLVAVAFTTARVVAVDPASGEVRVVSEAPKEILGGIASPAFGAGAGFDARCLYLTNLLKGRLLRLCP
jgi:sugar lactone lactonase YvrE